MSIFATKSIEQIIKTSSSAAPGLKRVLGPTQLMMLGVGADHRHGHLRPDRPGGGRQRRAGDRPLDGRRGPGERAGGRSATREFAASVPVAGSAYVYAYATLGEFVAWVIGWDLILEYALGAATVAVGWSGNAGDACCTRSASSFPGGAQRRARHAWCTVAGGDPVTAVFNLPAVLITVAVTALLIVGRQRVGLGQRRRSSSSRWLSSSW